MEIHWRNPNELRDEDREQAEERIRGLAEGHSDLIDVWVDVEERTGHHRQGPITVALRGEVRGSEIMAHGREEEPGLALRRALKTFERTLGRLRERRRERRSERPAEPPLLAVVDRVFPDDGYGFLLTDDGEQVYFHRNAVRDQLAFESLEEGQRVSLDVEAGAKGLQATFVAPCPPDAPRP